MLIKSLTVQQRAFYDYLTVWGDIGIPDRLRYAAMVGDYSEAYVLESMSMFIPDCYVV
jgi:hypothetical protein